VEGSQQYVAVQTHLVDGTEVPLAVIESRKMYEIEKYVSMTNHMWTNYGLYANADAMNKLPKDLHALMDRVFNAGGQASREDFAKADAQYASLLKSHGAVINEVDRNSFKAALHAAGVYPQWREHYGAEAWALLERSVGPLR
jgi:TRAP-type C4-dicarboxylate transport system substrate-binding protein